LKGLPWAPDEPSLAFDGARRLVSAAALATDPGQRCVSQYFPGEQFLILKGLTVLIFYYFKCKQRYCTVAPDQESDDPGRTMVFRSGWDPFQGARHG
jgi:hypothetical protein